MVDKPLHPIIQAFSGSIRGFDSSRQLAFGIAIGMMIGLVPKDNLIFVGLLVLLIVSGANLVTGIGTAVLTALLSARLENVFEFTGTQILGTEFVSTLVAEFLKLPFVAWTDINNTVVCGSLFLGLALFVPIYFVSFAMFHHFRSRIKNILESNILRSVNGLS